VEELRKEQVLLQKHQEVNFGIMSKQVNLKTQKLDIIKGGGLKLKHPITTNVGVGFGFQPDSKASIDRVEGVSKESE